MTGITFVQTADPIFYKPMLDETSKTVRLFCMNNGFSYESYVGVKRGTMPWHAAYNRIHMLKELLDRGSRDWVFYLDADALIHDLTFDVRTYLQDKDRVAGIFAGHLDGITPFHINSGGFAVNLGHPSGRKLAFDYWDALQAIPDETFNNAVVWGREIDEDQLMLHKILKGYVETQGIGSDFLFEPANRSFTNHGPFIRQHLRSTSANFRERMASVREEVRAILADTEADWTLDGPGYYLGAVHPRLKTGTGRKGIGEVRSTGRAGAVSYGPYVPLKAGNYVVRVHGEVRQPLDGGRIAVGARVTSETGETLWAEIDSGLEAPASGIIVEHRFQLTRDALQCEVVVLADERQNLSIRAVQINWTDLWVAEG